jgi:hypothetical protein
MYERSIQDRSREDPFLTIVKFISLFAGGFILLHFLELVVTLFSRLGIALILFDFVVGTSKFPLRSRVLYFVYLVVNLRFIFALAGTDMKEQTVPSFGKTI